VILRQLEAGTYKIIKKKKLLKFIKKEEFPVTNDTDSSNKKMRFAVYHSTKGRNWQQKASHSVSHDSPSFAHAIVFRQIQVTDDLDILNTKKTVDWIFLSCVSGSTQL
jgi:hypothetical protein